MAYSTNPFSVATFGESYEHASPTVIHTGGVRTGAVDTGIDVSPRTNVDLVGDRKSFVEAKSVTLGCRLTLK